jgi:F-type H+-transporting ATPase subunit c
MKPLQLVAMVVIVVLMTAAPALAQTSPTSTSFSGAGLGAGFGAGLTLVGAGWGFGRIGQAALEGMARQPEIAGRIQTGMIVIAALLEGATFFALLICFQVGGKLVTNVAF